MARASPEVQLHLLPLTHLTISLGRRISLLEDTILRCNSDFLLQFFSTWSIQSIISLGKVNKRLHQVVKLYSTMMWNVSAFLGHYFSDLNELKRLLSEERFVLFGPAVFSFFDRRTFQFWPLDICICVNSMDNFIRLLQIEGYIYVDGPPGIPSFETAVLGELIRTPYIKLKSNGERNSSESDRSAWGPYVFSKDEIQELRIRVYVVRCDAYRHVLSLRATGLMNLITFKHAVSLFPRSTFMHKRSFVSQQEDTPLYFPLHNEHFWLEHNKKVFNVETIGLTHEPFEDVEMGK
ncbi:hypothetical protein CVT26_015426, partial [Gymnopilus dilepis]